MTKSKYQIESEALYKEVCRLALEETNWSFEKEQNGCKAYKTYTPASKRIPCFKIELLLEMSPERVNDVMNPFGPYRKECDSTLYSIKLVEEISENVAIGYKVFHTTYLGITTNTDDTHLIMSGKNDKFHYNMATHIDVEDFTESTGHRIQAFPCGTLIFGTDDPNVSRMIFLYHTDTKVTKLVPQAIVDKIMLINLLEFLENLKAMKDKPYKRLGPDVLFCRNRI